MTDAIASIIALAGAAFFGFIGWNAMRRPRSLLRSFDLVAETPDARNEVRGIYGGLTVAFAVVLVAASFSTWWSPTVLLVVAGLTAGMAAGRVITAAIDRSFGRAPRQWFVAETIVAGALTIAAGLR